MENIEFTKEEIKWTKDLKKILDKQPDTLIAFCTGIDINFYQGKELPTLPNSDNQVDGSVECIAVKSKNWEAGAY